MFSKVSKVTVDESRKKSPDQVAQRHYGSPQEHPLKKGCVRGRARGPRTVTCLRACACVRACMRASVRVCWVGRGGRSASTEDWEINGTERMEAAGLSGRSREGRKERKQMGLEKELVSRGGFVSFCSGL